MEVQFFSANLRRPIWHVADVPKGRGNWKFRSLEAWKFGTTPHPSPRRGAPFSVAVEGLALRACTLRSLFSGAASPPLGSQRALARPKSATNLRNLRFPFWQSFVQFHRRRRRQPGPQPLGLLQTSKGSPGLNRWGSSKLPSLQTSKLPWSVLRALARP